MTQFTIVFWAIIGHKNVFYILTIIPDIQWYENCIVKLSSPDLEQRPGLFRAGRKATYTFIDIFRTHVRPL